jgi:hypothetical protein
MLPYNRWLAIETYRDFYDVPHFILARDGVAGYWILDSSFDDERDDYAADYLLMFAGTDDVAARELYEQIAKGGRGEIAGSHPVALTSFDPTRRRELMLQFAGSRPVSASQGDES